MIAQLSFALLTSIGFPVAPTGLGAPSVQVSSPGLGSPFLPLKEEASVLSMRLDKGGYAALDQAHASKAVTHLVGLNLPDGVVADLDLIPIDPWEQDAQAVVVGADGVTRPLATSMRIFQLRATAGRGEGFLGVSPSMVHGVLSLDGDAYTFSTGKGPGQTLLVAKSRLAGAAEVATWCETATSRIAPPVQGRRPSPGPGPELRITTSFIEVDYPLRLEFASVQDAADYATLLVGVADAIYRRDLGVRIMIPDGYLRVWDRKAPWKPLKPAQFGTASKLRDWWNSSANPLTNIPRTQVHALTHYYNAFTVSNNWGFANGIGVICDKSKSYAVTSLEGSFPFPVQHQSANNADLYLFAHESGHLFGSIHTQDYVPRIRCGDGTGPDRGTLMSYCYGPSGNSVAGIGMRFHPRVQVQLQNTVDQASCVKYQAIRLGDYDANGILDPRDVASLDAYRAQGFSSLGALESLDMNGDGVVSGADRGLLIAAQAPRASARMFNGNNRNRVALKSMSRPLLGAPWTGSIRKATSTPVMTMLIASNLRQSPPIATRNGELLIRLPGSGGRSLFKSLALTNGIFATHSVGIPFDPALAGFLVETQGAVLAPTGIELLNGLTLQLSSY